MLRAISGADKRAGRRWLLIRYGLSARAATMPPLLPFHFRAGPLAIKCAAAGFNATPDFTSFHIE